MRLAIEKVQEPNYMEQLEKSGGKEKEVYSNCPICGQELPQEDRGA